MSALLTQTQLLASLTKAGLPATLIQKADLQMSDLVGTDGYLVEEQAARWQRRMIKSQKVLPLMTWRTTSKPKYTEPKIAYDPGNIWRLAADGVALTEAERVKPTIDDVEWEPVELIAETRFTKQELEDNIEGNNLQTVIREELTRAGGSHLEKIVLQGDTSLPPSSGIHMWDGLIKTATVNVVPNVGTTLDKNVLRSLFKVMDDEFLDKSMAKFWVAPDAEEDFRDTVASRQTASGDAAFGSAVSGTVPRIAFNGVEVVPIPWMPVNLGVGEDESVVLLADPKNAVLVTRREMTLETEYNISARKWTTVMTIRTIANWREKRAVAKATGLLTNAA